MLQDSTTKYNNQAAAFVPTRSALSIAKPFFPTKKTGANKENAFPAEFVPQRAPESPEILSDKSTANAASKSVKTDKTKFKT